VSHLRRVLKPGGRLALTVYHDDLYRRLRRRLGLRYPDIDKQGYHGGRIYYYAFTRRELQQELEPLFAIERLRGIVNVPRELFSRLGAAGPLGRAASVMDRALSWTPLASSTGLLLLAVGRRRE
jgi:hypothetical protein